MRRAALLAVLAMALVATAGPAESVRTDLEVIAVDARGAGPATSTIVVQQGEWFRIEAVGSWTSGRWTGGPDGDVVAGPQGGDYLIPGSTPYGLLARIGEGRPLHVGSSYAGVARETGPIRFTMNDVPGITWDNRGALEVRIVVERRP